MLEGDRGRAPTEILALRFEELPRFRFHTGGGRRCAAATRVRIDHPLTANLHRELLTVLVERHPGLADGLREGQLSAERLALPCDLAVDEARDLRVLDRDGVAGRRLDDEQLVDRPLERFAVEAVEHRRVLGHGLPPRREEAEHAFVEVGLEDHAVADDGDDAVDHAAGRGRCLRPERRRAE